MRLTLRTLLAYLDDVLDPSSTREIGQKIEESPVASSLIEKVRDVLRKRSLGSPDVDDVEFDANDVAEYLDNVLSPEQIMELEKQCLENDEKLAETAASHQILSLVVGEPVDITDQTRERMYKVVADVIAANEEPPSADLSSDTAVVATYGAQSYTQPDSHSAIDTIDPDENKGPDSVFDEPIPDYLREHTSLGDTPWIKYGIYALGILWIAVLLMDQNLGIVQSIFYPEDSASLVAKNDSKPSAPPVPDPNVDSDKKSDDVKPDETKTTETPVDDATKEPVTKTPDTKPDDKTEPPVKPATVENKTPDPKTETPNVPEPDKKMIAKVPDPETKTTQPEVPKPDEKKEPEPPKPAEPPLPVEKMEYVHSNGILIRKETDSEEWFVLQDSAELKPDDELVSPEPFRTILNIPNSKLKTEIDAGTSLAILPPTKTLPFSFKIHRGRIILAHVSKSANKPVDNKTEEKEVKTEESKPREKLKTPVLLGVQIENETWQIEILESGTLCGLIVTPELPHRFEQILGEKSEWAQLQVVQGAVRVSKSGQKEPAKEVVAGTQFFFKQPSAKIMEENDPKTNNLFADDWITVNPWNKTLTRRKNALNFSREFSVEEPIRLVLPAVANDPRPNVSELAVKALALANRYQDLVYTLGRGTHEESRQAAINGLREWLPKSAENKDLLKAELAKVFDAETAKHVYHLLWGYNEEDAKDPERSKILVGWLEHEHIAIRELAIHAIRELTGKDYGYKPLEPATQRRADVTKWKTHIEREGALIKSE